MSPVRQESPDADGLFQKNKGTGLHGPVTSDAFCRQIIHLPGFKMHKHTFLIIEGTKLMN